MVLVKGEAGGEVGDLGGARQCGQIAPQGSAERLRCVDAKSQYVNARMCTSYYDPTAARNVSGSQACTRCVEAAVTNPLITGGVQLVLPGMDVTLWWVADGKGA